MWRAFSKRMFMIAYGTTPLTPMKLAQTLNQQSNGQFTVSLADGKVLSCQPDGHFETRPAGTAGAYELCTVNGGYLTFNPAGTPYTFAYVASVPN